MFSNYVFASVSIAVEENREDEDHLMYNVRRYLPSLVTSKLYEYRNSTSNSCKCHFW